MQVHGGQVDKRGVPYVMHLASVAGFISRDLHETPLRLCAAWLHDAYEDGNLFPDELLVNYQVPIEVDELVKVLTRREGEKYLEYIDRVSESKDATVVKLADLRDNMRSCPGDLYNRYRSAAGYLRSKW